MKRLFFLFCFIGMLLFHGLPFAAQSTITESEGYACMGEDKSRKQTEQTAVSDAKRKAAEFVLTRVKSETQVKDYQLEKDIIEAYADAAIEVMQEFEKGWYKDAAMGDCYKIKIKAAVTPNEKAMKNVSQAVDEPSAPLNINVWTDKKEYKRGDKIKVYVKGNKPFYVRVIYKDVDGNNLQLLPNPYRQDNYFNGGVVYEIPSGNDRFELEVSPPFGEENIVVYAATSQLGDINLEARGGVYQIKTKAKDIDGKTRAVILVEKEAGKKTPAEFSDKGITLKTTR